MRGHTSMPLSNNHQTALQPAAGSRQCRLSPGHLMIYLVELRAVSYQDHTAYQRGVVGNLAEVMPLPLADFGMVFTPGEY